jgi:cardiolipin synthase
MLVDGDWAFLGSSNCDFRSFRLNYELDFVCESGPFVASVHRQFVKEWGKSKEVSIVEHSKRGWYIRFFENVVSLFSPVL